MTAPVRRTLVRHLVDRGLSERRALAMVPMSASALRYVPRPDGNVEMRERILAAINAIPHGQVLGYGEVAARAGLPGRARLVARLLANNDDPQLPWHRVLRSDGRIALPEGSSGWHEQTQRLRAEGVVVEQGSVLSMGVYLGASTKIVDRETGEVHRGVVPPYSVVVPGSLPDANGGPSLYCAVIVKRVDAQTRAKTGVNELLRD